MGEGGGSPAWEAELRAAAASPPRAVRPWEEDLEAAGRALRGIEGPGAGAGPGAGPGPGPGPGTAQQGGTPGRSGGEWEAALDGFATERGGAVPGAGGAAAPRPWEAALSVAAAQGLKAIDAAAREQAGVGTGSAAGDGGQGTGREWAAVRDNFGAPAAHFPEWESDPALPVKRDSPGDWEFKGMPAKDA